jgi:hypothetical protein
VLKKSASHVIHERQLFRMSFMLERRLYAYNEGCILVRLFHVHKINQEP